jgi:hypothetical protein
MAYTYYRPITIDYTKVSTSNHTDFPVVIAGTYSYLATTANGGNVESANGYDIKFTSDEAGTTQLKQQTESWDATTGRIEIIVKIPTLSYTSNTTIYMWYGDSSVTTSNDDASNVWNSAYKFVCNMNADPSTTVYDSTSSPAHMTTQGSMTSGDLVDGAIGKSVVFERSKSQYAKTATSVAKLNITGDYTLEYYGKFNDVTLENVLLGRGDGGAYLQYWLSTENTAKVWLVSSGGGNFKSTSTLTTGTYYYIVGVRDVTTGRIYINGTQDNTGTGFNNPASRTEPLFHGYNNYSPVQRYGDSETAFLRVSNVARSAGWIATIYNNINSPSTFYSIGAAVGGVTSELKKVASVPYASIKKIDKIAIASVKKFSGIA